MKMRNLGRGMYTQIARDGDFAFRIDYGDKWELHRWCPKFRVCIIKVHRGEPDQSQALWHWDGNEDEPTIRPSIGCDTPPRCGRHVTIIGGVAK